MFAKFIRNVQALLMATVGVVFNVLIMGGFLKWCLPYDWSWEFSFMTSSILAATDPVAVVALLNELGASKTLSMLIEGESMMNDGTAIVLFLLFFDFAKGEDKSTGEIIEFFLQVTTLTRPAAHPNCCASTPVCLPFNVVLLIAPTAQLAGSTCRPCHRYRFRDGYAVVAWHGIQRRSRRHQLDSGRLLPGVLRLRRSVRLLRGVRCGRPWRLPRSRRQTILCGAHLKSDPYQHVVVLIYTLIQQTSQLGTRRGGRQSSQPPLQT